MNARRLGRTSMALCLIVMGLLVAPWPAQAISTDEIVSSAESTDCMDYRVIGICVWLTCTPFGCDTDTSTRVGHYLPDLVVSTYHNTGENPWEDVASMSSPKSGAEAGGNTQERTAGKGHEQIKFKEADAIGHPASIGFDLLSDTGYSCESAATIMFPYFLSVLDKRAWRNGHNPEKKYPEAKRPGLRQIATPGNNWGHVYPRIGFVSQANGYKAAAVVAQRVADIVTRKFIPQLTNVANIGRLRTRTGLPHVYWPLTADHRQGYWPPGPVFEADADTGKWQRLQPNLTKACHAFPDRSATASFAGDTADDGDYVWALWRPYSCCEQRGAILIVATGRYP